MSNTRSIRKLCPMERAMDGDMTRKERAYAKERTMAKFRTACRRDEHSALAGMMED